MLFHNQEVVSFVGKREGKVVSIYFDGKTEGKFILFA